MNALSPRRLGWRVRLLAVAATAAVAVSTIAGAAFGDVVTNDVAVGGGSGGQKVIQEGQTAEISYWIKNSGQCDANESSPATVVIAVPGGVTAIPSSLTFTECDTSESVKFAAPVGQYAIPVVRVIDGDGSYNVAATAFRLIVESVTTPTPNTAPVVTISSDAVDGGFVEGNTTGGATLSFSASASDTEDGPLTPECDAASGFFALGAHTVTCTATDLAGARSSATLTFTVRDTTAPSLTVPADISLTATSAAGTPVPFAGLAVTDVVDPQPSVTCRDTSRADAPIASGATLLGTHVISCTGLDASGNASAAKSFTAKVLFDFFGFYSPVNNNVLNTMKAGSTAPIKFRVGNGSGGYLGDLGVIDTSITGSRVISCLNIGQDALEEYATGGTSLRFDPTAQQFIYNWQSPKAPGSCYRIRIALTDGTSRTADFNLR